VGLVVGVAQGVGVGLGVGVAAVGGHGVMGRVPAAAGGARRGMAGSMIEHALWGASLGRCRRGPATLSKAWMVIPAL
jgi:hypothetical protein